MGNPLYMNFDKVQGFVRPDQRALPQTPTNVQARTSQTGQSAIAQQQESFQRLPAMGTVYVPMQLNSSQQNVQQGAARVNTAANHYISPEAHFSDGSVPVTGRNQFQQVESTGHNQFKSGPGLTSAQREAVGLPTQAPPKPSRATKPASTPLKYTSLPPEKNMKPNIRYSQAPDLYSPHGEVADRVQILEKKYNDMPFLPLTPKGRSEKKKLENEIKEAKQELTETVQKDISQITAKLFNSRVDKSKSAWDKNMALMHQVMDSARKGGIADSPEIKQARAESHHKLHDALIVSFSNSYKTANADFNEAVAVAINGNGRVPAEALKKYAAQLNNFESNIQKFPPNVRAGLKEEIKELRANIKNALVNNLENLNANVKNSVGNEDAWNQTVMSVIRWTIHTKVIQNAAGFPESSRIDKAYSRLLDQVDNSAKKHYEALKAKQFPVPLHSTSNTAGLEAKVQALRNFQEGLSMLPRSKTTKNLFDRTDDRIGKLVAEIQDRKINKFRK